MTHLLDGHLRRVRIDLERGDTNRYTFVLCPRIVFPEEVNFLKRTQLCNKIDANLSRPVDVTMYGFEGTGEVKWKFIGNGIYGLECDSSSDSEAFARLAAYEAVNNSIMAVTEKDRPIFDYLVVKVVRPLRATPTRESKGTKYIQVER